MFITVSFYWHLFPELEGVAMRWGSFSVLIFHFHLLNQLLFQQMNTRACTSAVADVSLLHADFATLLTFTLGRS